MFHVSLLTFSFYFDALSYGFPFSFVTDQVLYSSQSQPVEDFYRRRDVLLDFDVGGGIPETWPRLLKALYDENRERELLEPEPRAA